MSVTRRYVYLTAAGGAVTVLLWPFGAYGMVFLLWNFLLLGLLVLDSILTPGVKFIQTRRETDDTLYFKTENQVTFYVKNKSSQMLNIEGKDDSNRHFQIIEESPPCWVAPQKEQAFTYITIPSKRGSFVFENLHLRYIGVLGLCKKHVVINNPIDYKVYPNIKDLSKYRLMVQKNRLLPQGEKLIRQYGMGADFENLRSYVEGDDYRKINWQATARESKLIVNQYQIERNQPVYILLDTGRPMSYTVKGYKKLDYAINAAIILSDIVNQQGDKAGLVVFDACVKSHITPGQGAGHKNIIMETLYHVNDNRLTANYEAAFQALSQKRRSLVFIFTDFEVLEEAEDLIAHMAMLKKRHLPIVVFMKNEALNNLAEKPATRKFDKILKETAEEFQQERKNIFRKLNAMGIPNVESTAENFALSAVNRYITIRDKN